MKNIKILDTGIDVSGVLAQLKQYPEDWGSQKKMEGVGDLVNEWGFPVMDVGTLQLVVGAVHSKDEFVGDSELCVPTPAFERHTEIIRILSSYVRDVSRCGFLSLPVGGQVGSHIDMGTYYLTRDRYHLSIQGKYKYTCGDESVIVEPGTLLWFNNKLPHSALNISDEVRITFVFDVKNPELVALQREMR